MNRWRARLTELQGADTGSLHVQNVQNVQNSPSTLTFEHFERFEHCPETSKETPGPQLHTERECVAVPIGLAITAKPALTPAMPVEAWRAGIAKLRPGRAISHPSQQGWEIFLCDCRSFLAGEWADRAATLGWDARQLFGVHRERPSVCNWWGALLAPRRGRDIGNDGHDYPDQDPPRHPTISAKARHYRLRLHRRGLGYRRVGPFVFKLSKMFKTRWLGVARRRRRTLTNNVRQCSSSPQSSPSPCLWNHDVNTGGCSTVPYLRARRSFLRQRARWPTWSLSDTSLAGQFPRPPFA
jgi:hypothetical protein